jgi:hypothetical protein
MIIQASFAHEEEAQEREEARRQREWVVRDDPNLHLLVDVEEVKFRDLVEFQRWLASETGLSVVSDYFTGVRGFAPSELRNEETVPLWQLLYAMGDQWGFRWQGVGKCLRFHHAKWYERAESEVPEALLFSFLRKWHGGTLALEDVVNFVGAVADKPRLHLSLPMEVRIAGFRRAMWVFQVYASLTPEQRAAARGPAGVRMSDMSEKIRNLILARAVNPNVVDPRSQQDYTKATLHVEEADEHHEEYGKSWDVHRVRMFLKLADGRTDGGYVVLPRTESDIMYAPFIQAVTE